MEQMAKSMDSILDVKDAQGGVYPALLGTLGFKLDAVDLKFLEAQYGAAVAASEAAYRELNAVVPKDTSASAAPVRVAPVEVAPVRAPSAPVPAKVSSSQRPTRSAGPSSAEDLAALDAALDAELGKFD